MSVPPGMWTRRQFLGRLAGTALVGVVGGAAFALREAKVCGVERISLVLRNLPTAFDGTTLAFAGSAAWRSTDGSAFISVGIGLTLTRRASS